MKAAILVLACLLATTAFGQTQVPNEFQSGQPARASEVNENFDALELAVDANASEAAANASSIATNATDIQQNTNDIASGMNGGVPVFAQGTLIGRVIDTKGQQLIMVSQSGYLFALTPNPDNTQYMEQIGALYFSEPSCMGTAYASPGQLIDIWRLALGVVFETSGGSPATHYYTERGGLFLANQSYQSYDTRGGCSNGNGTISGFPAFANDPLVTDVSNTAPPDPITIGVP